MYLIGYNVEKMEGIVFNKKHGILDMVLSGQKTMFRVQSRQRKPDALYNNFKYHVGDIIPILQSYKELEFNPNDSCMEKNEDGHFITMLVKDSKGWSNAQYVDVRKMPYSIQITGVKTERIQDISNDDCRLEGIIPVDVNDVGLLDGNMPFEGYSLDGKSWAGDTPQEVFKNVSNKFVKKDAWLNNKLVDCYTFKLIKERN